MGKEKKEKFQPTPVRVTDEDQLWWCACGHSDKQPFCDGAHRKTEKHPLPFTPEKPGEVWLCNCKQTKNPPYCDGTHNALNEE